MYLYRAEDPQVNTLEFSLNPHELRQSAKRFFSRALDAPQIGLISLTLTKQALFPSSIFSIAHRAHTTQASFGSNCLASTTTILKKSFEAPSQ